MFQKDEFLFKFDLKSGYHHVDIYPEPQNIWDLSGIVMAMLTIMFLQFCLLVCLLHAICLPSL